MKRVIAILLAVMLLVAVMPAAAFADSTKTVYISRRGSGTINMHKGPGYDYAQTGNYVKHNDKVTLKKTSDGWAKIKVKRTGKTGWIRDYYVDGTTKKLGTGTHAMKKAANVYSKASVSSSIKKKLSVGDTVKVYETSHDFAYVTITGSSVKGWVPMRCIGSAVSTKADKPSGGSNDVYRVKTFTGDNLNVRSSAGMGDNIITSIPQGWGFTVLKKSGSWYKVRTFGGTTGWVSKKYVKAGAYADVCTRSTGLNIRKGPGTCYGIKGSFAHGTRHLLVSKVSGNWAYVTKNCKSGWCSMNYLDWCHC